MSEPGRAFAGLPGLTYGEGIRRCVDFQHDKEATAPLTYTMASYHAHWTGDFAENILVVPYKSAAALFCLTWRTEFTTVGIAFTRLMIIIVTLVVISTTVVVVSTGIYHSTRCKLLGRHRLSRHRGRLLHHLPRHRSQRRGLSPPRLLAPGEQQVNRLPVISSSSSANLSNIHARVDC
jgi:hypothetical protein